MRAERITRVLRKVGVSKNDKNLYLSILKVAEKKLNKGKNWIKNNYKKNGEFCLIGAVGQSNAYGPVKGVLALALPGLDKVNNDSLSYCDFDLGCFGNNYEHRVTDWNDDSRRNFNQISKVIKRAKTALRGV